jgi:hypothetical protein
MVPFVVVMPSIIFARPSAEAKGHFGFIFFAPIITYDRYDPWKHQFIFIQIAIIKTVYMPQKVLFGPCQKKPKM